MKMIDKEYVSPGINENYLFSSQSRLDSYRREIEAQAQAEINIKVCFLQCSWIQCSGKYREQHDKHIIIYH